MERIRSAFSLRLATLKAIVALVFARILVRFAPLSMWSGSLERSARPDDTQTNHRDVELEELKFWARRVGRAAARLPGNSKCLPQAVALQWILRSRSMPSALIIALHKTDRDHAHSLHAWVETDDEMLIGHCDREQYSVVARFEQ